MAQKPNDILPPEWVDIRPRLVVYLTEARKARLILEEEQRMDRARSITEAKPAYERTYLLLFRPSEWYYLPSAEVFVQTSDFVNLLATDAKARVHGHSWFLSDAVARWVEHKRGLHNAMLPDECRRRATIREMNPSPISRYDGFGHLRPWQDVSGMDRFLGSLTLAIAVFRTNEGGRVLIAQDACHAWKEDITLEFSSRGSAAGRKMCEILNVPLDTRASTMDKLDKRFVCLSCHNANGGSWSGVKAHTWRTGVGSSVRHQGLLI